jgi:hypothetical protein
VRGHRTIINWEDHWYYIDAAVAAPRNEVRWSGEPEGATPPQQGMRVYKIGAASGYTEGVIEDALHLDRVEMGALQLGTPNQVLIRPLPAYRRFATDGDSGAFVRDERGRPVALLWGADASGRAVGCPMEPVLDYLEVSLW